MRRLTRWTSCSRAGLSGSVPSLAVAPTFRSVPDFALTNGDIAADVGSMIGLPPDPNQRDILDVIFAESKPGRLACFEAAVIAPRQNIKSSTLEIACLTDLFVFREPLSIWTAHLYKTTRSAFRDMVMRIDGCDSLRARCKKPTTANGNEAIELLTGERIEFHARSKGGGRGLTARRVTLDEALLLADAEMGALLPTLATQINAQVRYGSSAGLATSDVLRGVRDRGRLGADPSLGYLEWCAPRKDCGGENCSHRYGQVAGCALDDESLWWPANPSLEDRLPLDTLRKLRASLPPGEFMREFLGWWDEPAADAQGLPIQEWNSCADVAGQIDGAVTFCVDVALDRARSSLGVAGLRADGRFQGEIVAHDFGTAWLVQAAVAAATEWHAPVALDQSGPAASLQPELEAAGVEVIPLPRGEVVQACGHILDLVRRRGFAHLDDPVLNGAVDGARLRSGESFVFTRKGDVDISPLYAVTLATWVASTRPSGPSIYEDRGLLVL